MSGGLRPWPKWPRPRAGPGYASIYFILNLITLYIYIYIYSKICLQLSICPYVDVSCIPYYLPKY